MHEVMEGKIAESYHIRKLDDGSYLLSGNKGKDSFEYSYDSVDELLSDLKDDLGGQKDEKEDEEVPETLKKITRKSEEKEDEE